MVAVTADSVCTLVGMSQWKVGNCCWKEERQRNCGTDEFA